MTLAHRYGRFVVLIAGVVGALILPRILYPPVALDIAAWALFAVAVDLLLGYVGLLSFGQAAFWGTSAYITAIVAAKTGVAFQIAVLAGTVAAAVIAVPIGYLAVRRTGIYFAMVTLAFAQMLAYSPTNWTASPEATTACRTSHARSGGWTLPTPTTSITGCCRWSRSGYLPRGASCTRHSVPYCYPSATTHREHERSVTRYTSTRSRHSSFRRR